MTKKADISIDAQELETVVSADRSKSKKKWIGILGIVAVAILVIIVGVVTANGNNGKKLQAQLDLGNKYLDEMDYERALVAFNIVLEIDPKNVDAYEGLIKLYAAEQDAQGISETYLQAAAYLPEEDLARIRKSAADQLEALVRKAINAGNLDRAELYTELLAQVDGERAETMRALIQEQQEKEELAVQEVKKNIDPVFAEIALAAQKEEWDQVFDYMHSSKYEDFLAECRKMGDRYLIDTEYGRIGIYKIGDEEWEKNFGDYLLYYGEYSGEMRNGEGDWFGYHAGNNYHAHGSWANDYPNGYQEVKEWYSLLAENVTYRLVDGTVENGLWNGTINWNFQTGTELNENQVIFEKGRWVLASDKTDENGYYTVAGSESISVLENERYVQLGIVGYQK